MGHYLRRAGARGVKASLLAFSALTALAAAAPEMAIAQDRPTAERTYDFNLPAQPLARSVAAVASQAGLQVLYSDGEPTVVRAPALSGRMTADQALARLTAGTGFTFAYTQPGVITLRPARPQGASAEDGRVLGPVRVEGAQGSGLASTARGEGAASLGGVRLGQQDEAVGYRARVASVSAGAPTAIEDIPRSISILTQAQMQTQGIDDIGEALRALPGVTLLDTRTNTAVETGAAIFARGYRVQRFSVDGGATRSLNILDGGILDVSQYERIEIVRGPNGTFAGGENPGGTLNLVRKRPGARESLQVTGVAGSWDRHGLSIDWSTPSLLGSGLAFRGIISDTRQNYFYDNSDRGTQLLYGIFDIPLSARVNLEFGGNLSIVDETGDYSGLLRFSDGTLIPAARDTNYAPPWHHQQSNQRDLFLRVNADVTDKWQIQSGLSYTLTQNDTVNFLPQPSLDSRTGRVFPSLAGRAGNSRFLSQFQDIEQADWAFDVKLTGAFETFGLKHYVLVEGDLNENTQYRGTDQNPLDLQTKLIASVADLTSPYPQPALEPASKFPLRSSGFRAGVTLSDTISYKNLVDFNVTVRRFDAESSSLTIGSARFGVAANTPGAYAVYNGSDTPTWRLATPSPTSVGPSQTYQTPTWRPAYSLVVKPTKDLRLFLSYAEGSQFQNSFGLDGKNIGPSLFVNEEVGIKYGRETWSTSLTYYDLVTSNTARAIDPPVRTCRPTGTSPCVYPFGDTVKSTGYDFELNGELLSGLSVIASYNYNDSKTISTNAPLQTQAPARMAKLFLDYRPAWSPKMSLQLGLTGQGRYYAAGTRIPRDAQGNPILDSTGAAIRLPYEVEQASYVLVDLGATYQLNKSTQLDLRIENIGDKFYFTNPGLTNNIVGRPRNVTLTLRWRPWQDRSSNPIPTQLLNLEGWYAAADLGYHSPDPWSATSDGTKSDGSHADWDFKIGQDYLLAGRIGYRLTDHWRVEAETAIRPGDQKRITDASRVAPFGICGNTSTYSPLPAYPGCRGPDGQFDVYTLLTGVIRDFGASDGRLRPFVGLGAGFARTSIDINGRYDGFDPARAVGGDDVNVKFAWQIQAGASFRLTPASRLDVIYRHLTIVDTELQTFAVDPWLGTFKGDYQDNSVSAGLRYAF
jgi:outer membrane receptor for ferric coprogen and ferric-rhodotorulic acid